MVCPAQITIGLASIAMFHDKTTMCYLFCLDKTTILAPFYIIQKHHFSPVFPTFLRLQRTSTGRRQVKLDANTSVDYPGSFAAYCRAWDNGRNNVSCKEGQEPGKAPGKGKSGDVRDDYHWLVVSHMNVTLWL